MARLASFWTYLTRLRVGHYIKHTIDHDKRVAGPDRLTVEQIKSTWNYNHGNMKGIKLTAGVAKALEQDEYEEKRQR